MMVEVRDILLAVASFGPMVLLLYFTLKNYTFPKVEKPFFDDRKVFAFMTIGIVLGTVFFFVDSAIGGFYDISMVLLLAIFIPLLQSFIKLAILNWPKLQRKVDTSFYGLALGLGIAATYSFSKMYEALLGTYDLSSLLLAVMLGVQIVLIQGSTTAMIGVGCSRGMPWTYFAYSMMFALVYSFLMYGSGPAAEYLGSAVAVAMILAAWPVVIYAYWHVYRIDLPNLIDDAKRGFKSPSKK